MTLTSHIRNVGGSLFLRLKLLLLLLVMAQGVVVAQRPAPEYQVKAVFLYNFTKFIDWPPSSMGTQEVPFIIGVLGENPFGSYLEDVVAGERVNGHPIRFERFDDVRDVSGVHILYIASRDMDLVRDILHHVKQRNILTVNDHPAFVNNGGMVGFYLKENKIKLVINLRAARAAGLEISSRLLKVAEVHND